jgi:hypothetical protein
LAYALKNGIAEWVVWLGYPVDAGHIIGQRIGVDAAQMLLRPLGIEHDFELHWQLALGKVAGQRIRHLSLASRRWGRFFLPIYVGASVILWP